MEMHGMKLFNACALGAALLLGAGSASAFNFGDAAKIASQVSGGSQSSQGNANVLNLVSSLNSLGITPQQAVGGTGALLSVASNQLPASDYSQLVQQVPAVQQLTGNNGLSQLSGLSGLLGGSSKYQVSDAAQDALGNVQTMDDANQAFSALGMDAGLISQFAPILLQYLGNQGAGGALLQNLATAWGTSLAQ
jgi:hypothetical protein